MSQCVICEHRLPTAAVVEEYDVATDTVISTCVPCVELLARCHVDG